MKDDGKKKTTDEKDGQEKDPKITEFSNNFGYVELIVLPQLEVMARLSNLS